MGNHSSRAKHHHTPAATTTSSSPSSSSSSSTYSTTTTTAPAAASWPPPVPPPLCPTTSSTPPYVRAPSVGKTDSSPANPVPTLKRLPSSSSSGNGRVIYDSGLGRPQFDDDGGLTASFINPCGVAYERLTSSIFVSSTDAHRICVIGNDGVVAHLAGSAYNDSGYMDGAALASRFSSPMGIALHHKSRSLYVCDSGNGCVRAISLVPSSSSSFSSINIPGGPSLSMDDGTKGNGIASSSSSSSVSWEWQVTSPWPRIAFRACGGIKPTDIVVHYDDIFVTDQPAALVFQLSLPSSSNGGNGNGSGGVVRKFCSVVSPYGITLDRNDSLWVTATQEEKVWRFKGRHINDASSSAGDGNGSVGMAINESKIVIGCGKTGKVDSNAHKSSFNAPRGACYDPISGVVVVADTHNHAIRAIGITTGRVTTIAGGNGWGYKDGFAGAALFDHPTAVTVDHRGFIYVTDSRNGRIRRIAPVAALLHDNVAQMSLFPSELVMLIGTYLSTEGLVTTVTSDWERSLPGAAAANALLSPSWGDIGGLQTAYISPYDASYDWASQSTATDITDPQHRHPRRRTAAVNTGNTHTHTHTHNHSYYGPLSMTPPAIMVGPAPTTAATAPPLALVDHSTGNGNSSTATAPLALVDHSNSNSNSGARVASPSPLLQISYAP